MLMTDKERLKQIGEANSNYFRKNVLEDLTNAIDPSTENLRGELYIPEKERDIDFLKGILKALGYLARFEEDSYNPYWECTCYKIYLCR